MSVDEIYDMVEMLNTYNENHNSETRYWIQDDMYFICYNALSDMDEIEEISEEKIRKKFQEIFA